MNKESLKTNWNSPYKNYSKFTEKYQLKNLNELNKNQILMRELSSMLEFVYSNSKKHNFLNGDLELIDAIKNIIVSSEHNPKAVLEKIKNYDKQYHLHPITAEFIKLLNSTNSSNLDPIKITSRFHKYIVKHLAHTGLKYKKKDFENFQNYLNGKYNQDRTKAPEVKKPVELRPLSRLLNLAAGLIGLISPVLLHQNPSFAPTLPNNKPEDVSALFVGFTDGTQTSAEDFSPKEQTPPILVANSKTVKHLLIGGGNGKFNDVTREFVKSLQNKK